MQNRVKLFVQVCYQVTQFDNRPRLAETLSFFLPGCLNG